MRRKRENWLILYLFSWIYFTAHGQRTGFSTWQLTDKDGLPSNTVYQITEDKNGIIWLGTAAGLTRFNGFHFQTYFANNSLSTDASNMMYDAQGNLYFSNFNYELFVLDKSAAKPQKIEGINQENFNAQGKFLLTESNAIAFYHEAKVYVYQINTKKTKILFQGNTTITAFSSYGKNGIIWYSDKLYSSKDLENVVNNSSVQFNNTTASSKPFFYWSNAHQFYFQSIKKYATKEEHVQIKDFNQIKIKNINNYCLLSNDEFWIATTDGAYVFDRNGKEINNGKVFFKGKNISYIYKDSKNNYWFSTLNEGIFMLSNFDVSGVEFFTQDHQLNGATSFSVFGNVLFMGLQDGSILTKRENEEFQYQAIQMDRNVYSLFKLSSIPGFIINSSYVNALSNSKILKINELSAPKSLVEFNGQLYVANNNGFVILPLHLLSNGNTSATNNQNQYVIEKINAAGKLIERKNVNITYRLISGRTNRLFLDRENRIWISNVDGIFIFYPLLKKAVQLEHEKQTEIPADFAESELGEIYIAMQNGKIYTWNKNNLQLLTSLPILNQNNIAKRIIYHQNRIWIASTAGLFQYNTKTKQWNSFQISDGVFSNDIHDIALFENKVWIATFKGINILPINYIPSNPFAPSIFGLNCKVNGKIVELEDNHFLRAVANSGSLEFHFEGVNYKSRNLLFYKYKLKGIHTEWQYLSGTNNSLVFQDLPAGAYRLEIVAFNDKNIGSKPLVYHIHLKKPFWQSWLFWAFVMIAAAGIAYFLLRQKQQTKLKKERLESELRISQLSSLKAQMNPHFMFNALNSIQDFILLNNKESANEYFGKFSDLMRLVLDMSNQQEISLSKEIEALRLYLELEALRFDDNFEYTFEWDSELDASEWFLPSMIIQPFVENAIKHGLLHKTNDRKLKIELHRNLNMLQVIIKDNGIGRVASERINANRQKRYTSFATGATVKRLNLLNQEYKNQIAVNIRDLVDENNVALGTEVELVIPVKNRQIQ